MLRKTIIEDSFSVDDIHKVREQHYEMTKNLSRDERLKEIKNKAEKVKKELGNKESKRAVV